MMGETLRTIGPYLVLAFFAAQFIACFGHARLGEMLAIVGGTWLASLGLPAAGLAVAFVVVVIVGNLVLGSASAKYALFAPVFVPTFMQAGISPELTQAAFRVGDSSPTGHAVQPLPDHHPRLHPPLPAGRRSEKSEGRDFSRKIGSRSTPSSAVLQTPRP